MQQEEQRADAQANVKLINNDEAWKSKLLGSRTAALLRPGGPHTSSHFRAAVWIHLTLFTGCVSSKANF